MADIAPEMYENTKADYDRYVKDDKRLARIQNKVDKGTATWQDAYNYGVYIAEDLQKAFARNISAEKLPGGRMYFNIADRVVRPLLEDMEDKVRAVSKRIVEDQNKRNGIGLKAV